MNYIKNYSITFNASSLEFQSTPSVWRATRNRSFLNRLPLHFNPRPPWGGRRHSSHGLTPSCCISIHALRVEGDTVDGECMPKKFLFQSTPSVWRATLAKSDLTAAYEFQSTPSVWRATGAVGKMFFKLVISIHALRVEGDACLLQSTL